MAADDGHIKINTKIEGLQKVLKGFTDIGFAVQGFKTILGTVVGAAKKLYAALNDLNQAYNVQAKAEVQLATAVKNNPYLDSSSIKRLQDYASQLQSISTVGDEQLLPFMAQLAATGRSESEIMQIMSAALDASASGMISLDEAVRGLNMSYSGQIGRLGMQIPALKNLTAEELKAGKAVEVVARTYKGLASETATATGSTEQLKNAWGDLKEEYGRDIEKTLGRVRRFFTTLIKGWTDSKKAAREYKEAADAAVGIMLKSADDITEEELRTLQQRRNNVLGDIDKLKKELEDIERGQKEREKAGIAENPTVQTEIKERKERLQALQEEKVVLNEKISATMELRDIQKESADAEQAAIDRAEQEAKEDADRAQSRTDYIRKNTEAREQAIEKIKLTSKALGEEIDDEAILNEYVKSYVALLIETPGLVTAESKEAQALLEIIDKQMQAVKDRADAEARATAEQEKQDELRRAEQERAANMLADFKAKLDEVAVPDKRSLQEQLADQRQALEEFYYEIMNMETVSEEEKEQLQEEYTQKRIALIQMDKEAEAAAIDELKAKRQELFNESLSQLVSTVNTMASLAKENSKANLDVKIAEIEAEEISEEEKNKKILEAQKKAAKEQYRIELWQWTVSSLQAMANIAQGISKCFAENGPYGFITSALVAAAGAAQIATIIASKPQSPSFATGGIVPGTSYSGDRVQAMVNSGEMILNRQQQARLFDIANGAHGGDTNINIKNYRANDVDVSATVRDREIEIIIDRTVKKGLSNGRYDRELAIQQNNLNGTRVTN